ncbi:hypothetical protein [Granulicoccus sp. GXG6511]|uniref:hypothetical protein n=1 Tax=Granulicoccus sp. GXG6511 TaxID=3381351 RepID=UPI003D7E9F3C
MTTLILHRSGPDSWVVTSDPNQLTMPEMPAMLSLRGGLFAADARRPDLVPWADIDNVEAAADWILVFYGSEVLAALETEAAVGDHIAVEITDPPTNHPLARLALARWLHRWWPSAHAGVARLDQRLLRAEIGALTWAMQDWLDEADGPEAWLGTHEWAAVETAVAQAPGFASGAELALEPTASGGTAGRRTSFTASLHLLIDAADDLAPDSPVATADLPWPEELIEPALVPSEQDDYALTAGGTTTAAPDWWLVPPRSVGGGEDALRWTEDAGDLTVEVTVGDEPADGLRLRAYAEGDDFPVAAGPLVREGAVYRGRARSTAVEPIDLVEVYHPDQVRPPVPSGMAESWRRGVRGIVNLRTHAAATGQALGGIWPFAAEILATTPLTPQ